jgi:hypothetical protein
MKRSAHSRSLVLGTQLGVHARARAWHERAASAPRAPLRAAKVLLGWARKARRASRVRCRSATTCAAVEATLTRLISLADSRPPHTAAVLGARASVHRARSVAHKQSGFAAIQFRLAAAISAVQGASVLGRAALTSAVLVPESLIPRGHLRVISQRCTKILKPWPWLPQRPTKSNWCSTGSYR